MLICLGILNLKEVFSSYHSWQKVNNKIGSALEEMHGNSVEGRSSGSFIETTCANCIVTLHSSKDSLKIHITRTLQRRETKRLSHVSRKKWERIGGWGRGKWMREEREVGEI